MVFEICTFVDIVADFILQDFFHFFFHFVHVYLRVANFDGFCDGNQPIMNQGLPGVVLNLVQLNLSLTENIHFFSLMIYTLEFSRGRKDTFFF